MMNNDLIKESIEDSSKIKWNGVSCEIYIIKPEKNESKDIINSRSFLAIAGKEKRHSKLNLFVEKNSSFTIEKALNFIVDIFRNKQFHSIEGKKESFYIASC